MMQPSLAKSRFMTWRDLVITPAVETALILLAGLSAWAAQRWLSAGALGMLLVFVAALAGFTIVALRVIQALHPLEPGVYSQATHPVTCYAWNLQAFLHLANLYYLTALPPPLRRPLYALMGARFGKGIVPVTGIVLDPWLLTVGDHAMLGHESLILGHALSSTNALLLGRVTVGRGAVVGARTVLMPGVTIGEGAMVNPNSIVPMNTTIPPHELWGGSPAQKIRDLRPPRPAAAPRRPAVRSPIVIDNVLAIAQEEPRRLFAKLVTSGGRSTELTYGSLVARAARFANLYRARGVERGELVIILLGHGEDLLASFVGAMLLGAVPSIFAPPSTKLPAEVQAQTLSELLTLSGARHLVTDRLPAGCERLRPILAHEAAGQPERLEPPKGLGADDIVLLQHSSGTTGMKKGVALSNRSITNQLQNLALALDLRAEDKIASWLPLYHDMGLVACLLLPLVTGTPVVMMSPFDWVVSPAMLLRAISDERATLSWLPNFAYNFLATRVRDQELAGVRLDSLRAVINCAEPVSADSHDLFHARFGQLGLRREALAASYAMAENTFAVTQGGITEPLRVETVDRRAFEEQGKAAPAVGPGATKRLASSGRVIANNSVRIVDAERRDVGERTVGEIAVQSDSMLAGYFHRPELTAEAVADGWYYTGDLGCLIDGHLFVTGRKKDMIIVAGKNIYPQDIEEIVSATPGIHPGRVVALGVPNEAGGTEEVVIIAESDLEGEPARRELVLAIARRVRERLECVANEVHIVPHMWLVKSSSGKIARSANRERYLQLQRRQHVVLEAPEGSGDTSRAGRGRTADQGVHRREHEAGAAG